MTEEVNMIVKVKYEETVPREAQVEVDAQEFLEWANEGYGKKGYATATEALAEEPGLLKEFLEAAGDSSAWAVGGDPFGYDEELLEAYL